MAAGLGRGPSEAGLILFEPRCCVHRSLPQCNRKAMQLNAVAPRKLGLARELGLTPSGDPAQVVGRGFSVKASNRPAVKTSCRMIRRSRMIKLYGSADVLKAPRTPGT